MRRRVSMGAGAVVAAVLARGLVYSAVYLDRPFPTGSYYGFCRNVLLLFEWMWSKAHGWPPLSHIEIFGRFYANVIPIVCPLIGFLVFRLVSRRGFDSSLWKPLLIVAACCPLT